MSPRQTLAGTARALSVVVAFASHAAYAANCDRTSIGAVPINDLGPGLYFGAQGGLYPGGSNLRPPAHDLAGRAIANVLTPLNAAGNPDPAGWIVLISIGMSNTSQEFTTFIQTMQSFPNAHPRLRIINCAQGGQDARAISDPNAAYWSTADSRLQQAGLTPAQVQAVWLKQAIAAPAFFAPGPFPAHPNTLRDLLQQIVEIIKSRYPNTRLLYGSSRIYAGYASSTLNPEPYAYDSAFAVKWLVERQISGAAMNWNPTSGPVTAPWIAWGPYLWADGLSPRSDGLIWDCADFQTDGTHPSASGREKVADMLLRFFSRDLTTRAWFVRRTADLNDDGAVSFSDVTLVLSTFGRSAGGAEILAGDANADGTTDFADITLVLAQFGM